MNYSIKDHRRMIMSSAVNSFGAALTWTGLPMYMATLTGNPHDAGVLFASSSIAGIGLTFIAGNFADRFSRKKIAIVTGVFSGLALLALLIALRSHAFQWFYFVASASAAFDVFGNAARSAWFSHINERIGSRLETSLGKKASLQMLAKLCGMGLGPILYVNFGGPVLIFDALTSFAEVALLLRVTDLRDYLHRGDTGKWGDLLQGELSHLRSNPQLRMLLLNTALSGLLSFPVIYAGILVLQTTFSASPNFVSVWWLMGAIGSLIANTLLSKGLLERTRHGVVLAAVTVSMLIGCLVMSQAPSATVFVSAFLLFTLGNPIVNTLLNAAIFRSASRGYQGRINALADMAFDGASMIGLALLTVATLKGPATPLLFLAILPVITVRILLMLKLNLSPQVGGPHDV